MFPENQGIDTEGASQLLQDFYAADRNSFMQFVYEQMTQVRGTDQAETVNGTSYMDAMDGNVVDGATEGDVLVGGAEADTYFVSDDLTRVVEEAGDTGWDQVVTDRDFVLSDHTNSQGQASEIEKVMLWYDADIDADASVATWQLDIYGNSGDNVLTAGSGSDGISAGDGDDTLYGNDGIDFLRDGGGNDHVYGGADGDVFYNGAGDDILEGGGGDDQFHFYHEDGAQYDRLTDFETGVDRIYITDMDMWSFSITATPEGTEFTYGVGRTVLIEDAVQMSDFTFLSSESTPAGQL